GIEVSCVQSGFRRTRVRAMLHDQKHNAELARTIEAIRKQLAQAKQRVKAIYPGARIRWIVEARTWAVVHPKTRETLEASASLDELATGEGAVGGKPMSGTHRRADDDD